MSFPRCGEVPDRRVPESRCPGLVCMSLDVRQRLFGHAMTLIADVDLSGQIVEITLTAERRVEIDRYPSGAA